MIKQVLFFIFILNVFTAFSQQRTTGKIFYKETIKFKFDVGENNSEFAKMLPPSQSNENVLYFRNGESQYKNHDQPKDTEINHDEGDNKFHMVIRVPQTNTYINTQEDVLLQSLELMGKEFLISDKPAPHTWKVTPEQKKILNYTCQKAILSDTSKTIAAWFTPQISVSAGPGGYAGLPGMILAIDQDNGERMTIATAIEDLPESFTFDKPSKGKKVSKKEFEKIKEEKMKEMGVINGKGNGVKMIIREEKH
jgi:GLPGLI family protein